MKKEQFHLPDGMIYLDGNSLGPLPVNATDRVACTMRDEWGKMLITSWNKAGWMALPGKVGDRIGRLIGAPKGTVTMGDTLSIKVYQALASALRMNAGRKIILSDNGNFPTDLYMAQGLIRSLDQGHSLKTVDPDQIANALTPDIAVLMLTQVDYRTGRLHDMAKLTERAQALGIIVIWDLAHSAGALPIDLNACNPEFAVGCTYKYLNGGPGAPAFIYVRKDLIDLIEPALSGWLGHQAPFDFDPEYRPSAGIERMRVGTPPILQLVALDAALDLWDDIDMQDLRARSIHLTELFIDQVEARCPDLTLASPRDPKLRGSQVSFYFSDSYAVMQTLISRGVIGDFRAPDIMRFGFTPLYIDETDVLGAVDILQEIMDSKAWDTPEFKQKLAVT